MKSLPVFPVLLFALMGCNGPASEPSKSLRIAKNPEHLATSPRITDITITRDNFSSLEFDTNLGSTKSKARARMRVQNGRLTVSTRRGKKYTASFSRAELDELLKILDTAQFPSLSGSYEQPKLYDAIYETVTLTLRGKSKDGKPLIFTVDNYGNQAPLAYKNVSRFLFRLRDRRFPSVAFEYISG